MHQGTGQDGMSTQPFFILGTESWHPSQSASQPHSSCPVTPVTLRRHPFLRQQRHRKEKVEKTRLRKKGSHGGLGRVLKKPKGLLANIQK